MWKHTALQQQDSLMQLRQLYGDIKHNSADFPKMTAQMNVRKNQSLEIKNPLWIIQVQK